VFIPSTFNTGKRNKFTLLFYPAHERNERLQPPALLNVIERMPHVANPPWYWPPFWCLRVWAVDTPSAMPTAAGKGIRLAVSGLIVLGLVYLALLGPLFSLLLALPTLAKVAITITLATPLAFCMGLPFPLGLSLLGSKAPQLLPWAWGVNGCASVLSAILATLLAIHFGFSTVVLLALALYGAASFAFGKTS